MLKKIIYEYVETDYSISVSDIACERKYIIIGHYHYENENGDTYVNDIPLGISMDELAAKETIEKLEELTHINN